MDFDMEKFKMVLHYIIYKYGLNNAVGKRVLFILLYFSDFNYFELFEKSLTNEQYRKLDQYPVPIHFDLAINELIGENKVKMNKEDLPLGKSMFNYFSLNKPSTYLRGEELTVIDEVIDILSFLNEEEICEYAYDDMPWKATVDNEIIDYGFVFYRDSQYVKRVYVEEN